MILGLVDNYDEGYLKGLMKGLLKRFLLTINFLSSLKLAASLGKVANGFYCYLDSSSYFYC